MAIDLIRKISFVRDESTINSHLYLNILNTL